ncbi:MAG: hypothetical protein OHK0046_02480 [Anaerolineae bacterium]
MRTTINRRILGLLMLLAGCTTTTPLPTPTPAFLTSLICAAFPAEVTCLEPVPQGVVLQTLAPVTVRTATISLTFDSTLYLRHENSTLAVIPLEGTVAIGAEGTMRVIQAGGQVIVPVDAALASTGAPGEILPYDANALRILPLETLPRPVSLPVPIAPQEQPTNPITQTTGCAAPEGWSGVYTVQRGDTLTRIAGVFNLTVAELQAGNCLANPNALRPGQVLVVPGDLQSAAVASFSAQTETLAAGECTTITWAAETARLVYFQGEATARSSTLQVCPEATTTYTLLVVLENGEQVGYTLTISVQ